MLENSFQNANANSFDNTVGIWNVCGKKADLARYNNDSKTDLLLVLLKEGVLHWGFIGKQVQYTVLSCPLWRAWR